LACIGTVGEWPSIGTHREWPSIGTERDALRGSHWDSLGRSGQLQGENRAEEEGPALRKISAFQGAGKAKDEGLCFGFLFGIFFFFFFFSNTPEYLQIEGGKK
jgi:hypothetical protein